MRKLFTLLAAVMLSVMTFAQINQYFWSNGKLMLGTQISPIDSITFGEIDADSIMLYIPRVAIRTVHDTMYKVIHDVVEQGAITANYECEDVIASGTCGKQGDNITWSLCSDSVIIFEGTGEMEDYPNFTAPWYSYIEAFHTGIVREGITVLGEDAFMNAHNMTRLILPTTLKQIDAMACHEATKLKYINLPDSLEDIGERAFLRCAFTSITIPASVTGIAGGAFQQCSSLKTVFMQSSVPVRPGYDIWNAIEDITIFVPKGSLAAYQNTDYWRDRASQLREYDYDPTSTCTPQVIYVHDTVVNTVHDTVIEFRYDSDTIHRGHELVDMGLPSGTKWATVNVGATSPSDYGGLYSWAETSTKTNYDWSTYKYCNGTYTSMTKYNTDTDYGDVDNKTVLEAEDDAATVNWGGNWRTPTRTEWEELQADSLCEWVWETRNGINGYKVRSRSNGNSIFLPAAGNNTSTRNRENEGGYYWSSTLDGFSDSAWILLFGVGKTGVDDDRCSGLTVRPVIGNNESNPTSTTTH